MASVAEFTAVVRFLEAAAQLPGRAPEATVAAYFDLLSDLPGDVLLVAAKRAALEHRFPNLPPPGVIRQHALTLTAGPAVPVAEAWGAVQAFAGRWSNWLIDGLPTHPGTLARLERDLAALPARARQAAEAYGWPAVVNTEPGVAFAHFRQLYESLDGPARREDALPLSARVGVILDGIGREGGGLRALS